MEKELIKALQLTYENANSLYEEAEILKEKLKIGRAYSLLHLCFEECGRFYILYNFLIEFFEGKIKAKDLNYGNLKKLGYESHETKISESFDGMLKTVGVFLMIKQQQQNLSIDSDEFNLKFKNLYQEIKSYKKKEKELNRLKNIGLYVTFENNKFHFPDDYFTARQYLDMQKIAKINLGLVKLVVDFFESKGGFLEMKKVLKK